MGRYTARPLKARWIADLDMETAMPESMTVFEPDDDAQFTGLYDARGDPLFRVREPLGFFRKD